MQYRTYNTMSGPARFKECACEDKCGRFFHLTPNQKRRKYHPECPFLSKEEARKAAETIARRKSQTAEAKAERARARKQIQVEKQREQARQLKALKETRRLERVQKRVADGHSPNVGGYHDQRSGRFCPHCFDIVHRRPLTGCPGCGRPYSEERLEVNPGRYSSTEFNASGH